MSRYSNKTKQTHRNIPSKRSERVNLPKMTREEQINLDAVVFVEGNPSLTRERRNKLRYKFYFMQGYEKKFASENKCVFCRSKLENSKMLEIHKLVHHTIIYQAYKESKKNGYFADAILKNKKRK